MWRCVAAERDLVETCVECLEGRVKPEDLGRTTYSIATAIACMLHESCDFSGTRGNGCSIFLGENPNGSHQLACQEALR